MGSLASMWAHEEVIGLDTLTQQTYWLYQNATTNDPARRVLWIVETDEKAESCERLLRFWASAQIGSPAPSITIFTARELQTKTLDGTHLETLFTLLRKTPGWVIVTLDGLDAVLPTPEELCATRTELTVDGHQSPSDLVTRLVSLGYETDSSTSTSGTLARTGGSVRIFPRGGEYPVRIEFDSNTIESITSFQWQTGITVSEHSSVIVDPSSVSWKSFYRRTKLLDYLRNVDAVILPNLEETLNPPEHAEHALKTFHRLPHVTLTIFGSITEDPIRVEYAKPPFYNHRLKEFREDVGKWKTEKVGMMIGVRTDRVQHLLASHDIASDHIKFISDVPEELESFLDADLQLVVLSEDDIFGLETRLRPSSSVGALEFLSDLSIGDFVVHLDHGIGRFQGMSKTTVEGISKEYFVILYDEGDKLFVPVEAADKITKYIGNPNPKLHRLHGASWHQVTQQARKSTLKTAKDLLALYAKRELAEAPAMSEETASERKLSKSFAYEETPDQERTIEEVLSDLEQPRPMDRLVCGDVGFGKTEVAIRAAMRAMQNGYQVALLSPTTILTQQHFDTFRERLEPLGVRIGILSRFETPSQQKTTVQETKDGEIDVLIGTHRILSNDVAFANLGLVIIDEEQRFGVRHKEKLKSLRNTTHILTLTATPIPRTLHFAISGLRSISSIETPPPGRLPIRNFIKPYDDALVKTAIEREVARSGQVYYLFNRVETIEAKKRYLEQMIPNVRFAVAHGQMSEKELMGVMHRFDAHEIDVLVCSTIVENGIDLPNVNTMIVDNATLLGLS
ncbi:MAG: DEAD/DEAH box helicase, partial [Candidatus Kerfeldbacteria bacterium]|nr:DEAD/DEAH box helicase [Candidatus Kerfeldbacteria bacterium]